MHKNAASAATRSALKPLTCDIFMIKYAKISFMASELHSGGNKL
jgi:hypothetical protein